METIKDKREGGMCIMNPIDLTQEVRDGILKALSDCRNSFSKDSFPMDDEEISSIIEETLNYLNE